MNSSIQAFNYEDFIVRTYTDDNGEPWLVAKDVCEFLGISKYRDAIADLDADERMSINVDTPGGKQDMTAINEPGLYKLTFRSKKPNAKEFTRRVTHEILPSIRKTGSYISPNVKRNTQTTKLPQHSGAVKAAERVLHKAFNCKKNADYQEVLALDDVFKSSFGYSALELAGLKLGKRIDHVRHFMDTKVGLDFLYPYYVDEEVFYWEHGYDLDTLATRRGEEEYC